VGLVVAAVVVAVAAAAAVLSLVASKQSLWHRLDVTEPAASVH